jgi:prepilin-type N-terminal cleavage/methylation domain-containing protein
VKTNLKRAFTLIELVMVIVIIGILAVTAWASFTNLQQKAKEAVEMAAVGGVREGLTGYFAKNRTFPATLDDASTGACSDANPFFTNVLGQGGVTEGWTKIDNTHYQGPTETLYTYTPSGVDAGSFK